MKSDKSIVYGPEWSPDYCKADRLRWVENASRGLRIVGPVHELREICRVNHDGWRLDPLGDGDTAHGVVLRLPGRSGSARFVPAVSDPCNEDCYLVDFHDHYDAPGDDTDDALRDCIHAADRMAERYAEAKREYRIHEQARAMIEAAGEGIKEARKEAHALAVELRVWSSWRNVSAPAICAAVRRDLARWRRQVRTEVARIRKLRADPYSWTY